VGDDRLKAGLDVRRAVLGDAYVDRAMDGVDDFNRDFQRLVSEYCWGEIWTRDGLPLQTRSLLNIAMMTALDRPHELRLHTQGALRNGCTSEQIREVLLQAAIYCGIPAGVDAFRVVRDVLTEAAADATPDAPQEA